MQRAPWRAAAASPSWLVRRTTSTTVPHCEKNSTMSSSVALHTQWAGGGGVGWGWGWGWTWRSYE